ncbi:kinase-like domain-containing protein [Dendryphion nanum]|uniref:non-specific serine/threonine protein kinase n=1 Tax=Dendryphion nanum TaxID=256645 RepID=A0A9P9DEN9_9PLEO|nr:kinase-like domain-containing protein [Dendryphion nanum]
MGEWDEVPVMSDPLSTGTGPGVAPAGSAAGPATGSAAGSVAGTPAGPAAPPTSYTHERRRNDAPFRYWLTFNEYQFFAFIEYTEPTKIRTLETQWANYLEMASPQHDLSEDPLIDIYLTGNTYPGFEVEDLPNEVEFLQWDEALHPPGYVTHEFAEIALEAAELEYASSLDQNSDELRFFLGYVRGWQIDHHTYTDPALVESYQKASRKERFNVIRKGNEQRPHYATSAPVGPWQGWTPKAYPPEIVVHRNVERYRNVRNDDDNYSESSSDYFSDASGDHEEVEYGWNKPTNPPTLNDERRLRRHMSRVIQDSGEWKFVKEIHNVSRMPNARNLYLFALRDQQKKTIRRIVVKKQTFESLDDLRSARGEYSFHNRITKVKSDYILPLLAGSQRNIEVGPPYQSYLYLDYLKFGDLKNLIPEGFIWHAFYGLAEALYVMATGRVANPDFPGTLQQCERRLKAERTWRPLIHQDIKAMNIGLQTPALNSKYPGLRRPLLLDFGLVKEFEGELGYGTRGWKAPEQRDDEQNFINGAKFQTIDSQADIYAVGLVIMNLMSSPGSQPRAVGVRTLIQPVQHRPNYQGMYSQELENLVKTCVQPNSIMRPHVAELLYDTRKGFEKYQKAYGSVVGLSENEVPAPYRLDVLNTLDQSDDLDFAGSLDAAGAADAATPMKRRSPEGPNAPSKRSKRPSRSRGNDQGQDNQEGGADGGGANEGGPGQPRDEPVATRNRTPPFIASMD